MPIIGHFGDFLVTLYHILTLKIEAAESKNLKQPSDRKTGHKSLVYFASGPCKKLYESLPFEKIYLVDHYFSGKGNRNNGRGNPNIQVNKSGKVICIGMDCLDAVNYLKQHEVKIDTFISLNEGLYEGGKGGYAINSDLVLGYIMPILNDTYIHIMNKSYYGNHYHVTMDLPYLKTEIFEDDPDYLNPLIFSEDEYHKGNAKVFRMKKSISVEDLNINPNIHLSIIQDSIWNYTAELDLLVTSLKPQGQGNFFDRLNKVVSLRENSIAEILDHCVQRKIGRIGITPWANGKYSTFIDQIKNYSKDYPKSISLFHLNRNDFKSLRELA